jgi:DNA polymerase-3 subunit gamma/tau
LYIEKLRKQNNNSGIANFKSSGLKIIDANNIEIVTESNLQQKFVENERAALLEHLQLHFNNRFLTYKVIVTENTDNKEPAEKHLNAKEQYLKMIEEYPLVKALKDKLKLDLEI